MGFGGLGVFRVYGEVCFLFCGGGGWGGGLEFSVTGKIICWIYVGIRDGDSIKGLESVRRGFIEI